MRRVPTCDTSLLLAAARSGDRSAMDALFARHRGRLVALVTCRMDTRLARAVPPEDVVQETYLEAARKIASFEEREPSSFYRWLVGIARWKIAEAGRAQRAQKRALETPLEADPAAAGTSPSGDAIQTERAVRVRDALAGLPEDQAEAVRLRWLDGLPLADAAARLGRSEAAVKSLVARGLAGLASRLPSDS